MIKTITIENVVSTQEAGVMLKGYSDDGTRMQYNDLLIAIPFEVIRALKNIDNKETTDEEVQH